jgi:GxxExxY protein
MLAHAELTECIIGAAMAVHRTLRSGFLEADHEAAPAAEFDHLGIRSQRQFVLPIDSRARQVGEPRRDFLVEKSVVVELKSVSELAGALPAILRAYLKATQLDAGLLLNFATLPLTTKRVGREDIARA